MVRVVIAELSAHEVNVRRLAAWGVPALVGSRSRVIGVASVCAAERRTPNADYTPPAECAIRYLLWSRRVSTEGGSPKNLLISVSDSFQIELFCRRPAGFADLFAPIGVGK